MNTNLLAVHIFCIASYSFFLREFYKENFSLASSFPSFYSLHFSLLVPGEPYQVKNVSTPAPVPAPSDADATGKRCFLRNL